jgi:TonB family protein
MTRTRPLHARPLAALALGLALVTTSGAASAQLRTAPPAPAAAPKLTRAPKLVTFVEAAYPEAERASGKTATVVFKVAIGADGKVSEAEVSESAGPAFDAAAKKAVLAFVFEPAEIDGKPSPIRILYRYSFVLKAELPTKGSFEGVVRGRKDRKPLAAVTVVLDSGERSVTDAGGRFRFTDVAPGKRTVTLSGEKLTALQTEETVEAGKQLDATYEVELQEAAPAPGAEADDMEIVIVAPPLRKQVVSTAVSADQGRKIPGTQGDVLKVVENLPGVGRSAAGSGALVVWGAAPEDTRVYIEGVRVPRLYHDGGLRSVVSSELVRSVELSPGGYGAPYGRGLGGLVTVELSPMEGKGFHGAVSADLLDASATIKAALTDKLSVAVAARKSWLDALLPVFTRRDVGVLFPIPRYADGQARIAYAISPRSSIELGGLASSDQTDRTVDSSDPTHRKTESKSLRWGRIYARYRQELEGGSAVTITPSFGADSSSLVSRFGATPTERSVDSIVVGLRASWRGRPHKDLVVTAGLDGELVSSSLRRAGSVTSPAREGDVRVFGQAPSDQINADSWSTLYLGAAPFVEADLSLLGDRLHVIPGLRFDPYVLSGSRRTPVEGETPSIGFFTGESLIEPRLALVADVSPRVRFKVAYGRYHQAPASEDLSAVFGNPLLIASRADHFLAGASFRLTETLGVESTAFYSMSADLAARSPYASPLLAQALVQSGAGRAFGAQLLVRKELSSRLFGWLGYSIVRSERRDRSSSNYRLFDFDQTHVLTALASYELGWGFEVGARFRFATGLPRTPVTGAYYDARTDSYQPVFGRQSSTRIPPFAQLDLRASRRFRAGPLELEATLDVQNVTNRSNPEELVYSADYSQKSTITGLPVLPSLGLRASW